VTRHLKNIGRRLIGLVLVLWGLLTLQFFLIRLTGDPAEIMAGPDPLPGMIESIREQMGLDRPLGEQYLTFLGDTARLDFGESFRTGRSAFGTVLAAVPASAYLALIAVAFSALVGVLLGVLGATRRGRFADRIVVSGSMLGQSIPNFVIAILLILLFSNTLGWLPSIGLSGWRSFIMPVLTLSIFMIARQTRLVRSLMIDELGRDYVRSGFANGMRPWRVRYILSVRNIIAPILGLSAIDLGAFLGGAVVVETVFAWPGIGLTLIRSVSGRDYPVLQAAVFVIAILVVLVHQGMQLLIQIIDPHERVHSARKEA
jgi:peptide/nickel transport system permease protein